MISCNTVDAALPAGAADDIAIVLDTTNAAEIRAFVWDGFENMTPLSNSFSLTLEGKVITIDNKIISKNGKRSRARLLDLIGKNIF